MTMPSTDPLRLFELHHFMDDRISVVSYLELHDAISSSFYFRFHCTNKDWIGSLDIIEQRRFLLKIVPYLVMNMLGMPVLK